VYSTQPGQPSYGRRGHPGVLRVEVCARRECSAVALGRLAPVEHVKQSADDGRIELRSGVA
jgi:hypothetical protein